VADFQEQLLRARRSAAQGDTAAAADAYRRAIACYRGDFLADEPYAEWSLSRREELAQLYLTALSEATDLFQRGGAWEESLRCCRVALARDPCREDFHRALMQLLWRLGRRAEALRQYRECAAVLDRELGVDPDPATQALGRRIAASP
jgi:two-component SAPR family response regulator